MPDLCHVPYALLHFRPVNRQHVITAGHCIKNKVMETINVTLGEYHIGQQFYKHIPFVAL
jgi:hypothetical protein